jgi:hypothetical protein
LCKISIDYVIKYIRLLNGNLNIDEFDFSKQIKLSVDKAIYGYLRMSIAHYDSVCILLDIQNKRITEHKLSGQ